MKLSRKSGTVIAATAAAMLMSGIAGISQASAEEAKNGMCVGANACKGLGSCKSANNACKGQASCKGQSWVSLTDDQCKQVGGKFEKAAG